jgi:hypothetical protein
MGKLIFSQKTIAGVSGLKPNTYYRVKSLLGGTYLYEIFNASDLYAAGSDTISIWQNGDINSTPITALNNDPEWIDPVSEQNIDNTLIPVGSVIFINSSLDHSYSGAVLVKYYQGKTSIKKQNLGGGKLNLNKKYLYKATGTGLSPNINGLRFYDSGLSFYTNKIFYDETNIYAMWINSTGNYWTIGLIAQVGTLPPNNVFYKAYSNSGEPPTGTYTAASGWTGTVIISEI